MWAATITIERFALSLVKRVSDSHGEHSCWSPRFSGPGAVFSHSPKPDSMLVGRLCRDLPLPALPRLRFSRYLAVHSGRRGRRLGLRLLRPFEARGFLFLYQNRAVGERNGPAL